MNTDRINALLLTIEKGSISAAAESMNYTPSAISRCIRSLENELGVLLISRSKHGVRLTSAGDILLPDLKRMLQHEMLLKEHASQLAEGMSGTIRIGVCYPAFYPWVSSAMASFKSVYPDVHYIVTNGLSSVLMNQTSRHEIDMCIISKLSDSCGWVQLFNDDLVAILPVDHPLAGEERVPISIFANEPYLELHSNKDTDNSRALGRSGIQPQSIIQLDDSSALYPMVEAGLGIAMENRINTLDHEGNFVIRPLDPPQTLQIGIAFHEDVLPATRKFIDFLSESKGLLNNEY